MADFSPYGDEFLTPRRGNDSDPWPAKEVRWTLISGHFASCMQSWLSIETWRTGSVPSVRTLPASTSACNARPLYRNLARWQEQTCPELSSRAA